MTTASELGFQGDCGQALYLEVVTKIQQRVSFCGNPFSCTYAVHILVILAKG